MNRIIHALPASLAMIALLPLFAVVTVAFSKGAFGTEVPAVFLSERFAFLVFDGIIIAAALFALSLVALIMEEL